MKRQAHSCQADDDSHWMAEATVARVPCVAATRNTREAPAVGMMVLVVWLHLGFCQGGHMTHILILDICIIVTSEWKKEVSRNHTTTT